MKLLPLFAVACVAATALHAQTSTSAPYTAPTTAAGADIFAPENLVAWCIVPFDARKRGPEERAQMLVQLGVKRLAYDYRAEHIPAFDAEVEAMKRHGVEFTAWWFPGTLNGEARTILAVIERHRIQPQLWVTGSGTATKTPDEQQQRIDEEAARLRPIAQAAEPLGCKVALYNHGGWFGDPDNQIAIIERLQRDGLRNVGIVYNFHHAHGDIARFPELWKKMQPHLLAVNLNGMELGGDTVGRKILNLSEGDQEVGMMRVIAESRWRGAVGILDHREHLDSEVALRDNSLGLEWVRREIAQPGSGGEKPKLESATPRRSASDATLGHWPLDDAPKSSAATLPEREPLESGCTSAAHPPDQPGPHLQLLRQAGTRLHRQARRSQCCSPPFQDSTAVASAIGAGQTEADWKSNRWNEMDVGSVRQVCSGARISSVHEEFPCGLGRMPPPASIPLTLTWPVAWRGGFVRFSSARFGFVGSVEPAGEAITAPKHDPAKAGSFTYRGFYRHGAHVIFAYERDGAAWLESAAEENGSVVVARERAGEGKLSELTGGGPAQWPQIFETSGALGAGEPYAIDTLTLPAQTPWRSLWHIAGLDFLPNGDAALCTFEGEVWLVSGIDDQLSRLKWKRFAAGLHQPLGLKVVDGMVCVTGRDQITRLHDLNGDNEADFYECFADGYDTPTGGHDYVTGLERDGEGRFLRCLGKARRGAGHTGCEAGGSARDRIAQSERARARPQGRSSRSGAGGRVDSGIDAV
jgi:sugar phosphate isomerase/epimerase